MRFSNRHRAGRALAEILGPHLRLPAVVYALPRGGVPVAVEIALYHGLDLDLVIPRKLGHPMQPEYAIGAVTETGEPVFNPSEREHIDQQWLERRIAAERIEARRRRELYCRDRPPVPARGRCAVLVDDGIATGLTMEAALREIQAQQPARTIIAVPVSPPETAERFAKLADAFVAVRVPDLFAGAIGSYYVDFRQLSDEDVLDELGRLPSAPPARPG